MATHDIFMPALSSTMTEGKIVEWLKQPGEKVARGNLSWWWSRIKPTWMWSRFKMAFWQLF